MKKHLFIFCLALFICFGLFPMRAAAEQSGDYTYRILEDGTAEITKYTGAFSVGDLEIPAEVDGYAVTGIGESAFYGRPSIVRSITVPEGVTYIGDKAFQSIGEGTSGDISIHLPDSLTSIGKHAFEGIWPAGFDSTVTINIPENVTSIGEYAFATTGLQSVTLPAGLTSIEAGVFSQTKLESVIIPGTVQSIGKEAFAENSYLSSVIISDGVVSISEKAFIDVFNLKEIEIPSSVTTIGEKAFGYYSNGNKIKDFTIYSEMYTVAYDYAEENGFLFFKAHGRCGDDLTWKLDPEGRLIISGTGDMWNYSSNQLPDWYGKGVHYVVTEKGVTSIGDYAFYHSSTVTSNYYYIYELTFSDSLTRIGNCAFYCCFGLEDISLPEGLTSIGNDAFFMCLDLKHVTLPDSLKDIGQYTFGWSTLESITLPKSLTSIGDSVFMGCTYLKDIVLPESLTSIGNSAFSNCDVLTSIVIPDGVTSIGQRAFNYCSALESIHLPDGLTSVADWTFANCSSLKNIVIPDGVTELGECAFVRCTGLSEVRLPAGLTVIGKDAFYSCSALTTLEIPAAVTSIGDLAFDNSGLTEITFSGSAPSFGLSVFEGVTATAYYYEDATWTDEVKLDYGGTITWQAIKTQDFVLGISSAEGKPGDEVELLVTVDENPGFDSAVFSLNYDKNTLELTGSKSLLTVGMVSADADSVSLVFSKSGGMYTGELISLKFRILDNAAEGTYEVSLGKTENYSPLDEKTGFACSSGSISVKVPGIFALSVSSAEGQPGDEVELIVTVTENPGFISGLFPMDLNIFMIEVMGHEVLADVGTVDAGPDGIRIEFNRSNTEFTGDLLKLKFRIRDHAEAGTYELGISKSDDFHPVDKNTGFSCTNGSITVTAPAVTTLTLDPAYMTLPVFETAPLEADTGGVPAELNWTSSDEEIATVDENGNVTAHKYGKATITVTVPGTELSAGCEVQTLFWDVADSSKYYFRHVYWAADHKPYAITKGYNLEYFAPEEECTRAQMMMFLWRMAGQPTPTSTKNPFKDVKAGAYYYKAVLWGVEKGITKGYSDGTFGVDLPCTREQAMTFLWRLKEKPDPQTTVNKFSDVKSSDYFYKAVLWASENGIANGYNSGEYAGKYGVGLPCLREHMVTFLSRYASKFGD